MAIKKRILVAPLNWGLGHATRCIPIIKALIDHGYQPIIGSDGMALELLKVEFPDEVCIELPSYQIKYPKKGKYFTYKLLQNSPKVVKAIRAEHKLVKALVKCKQIDGIISDNRLGAYNKNVPSVFITHQLHVLSGISTWLSSKLHQHYIKKFDVCWVPDRENQPNLSGKMGHVKKQLLPTQYIGAISRLEKIDLKICYDLMFLLSGPEPQRSILEEILMEQLKMYNGNYLFVRGKVESKQSITKKGNATIVNFLESKALEEAINKSQIIVARSGYSTILDLAKLGKRAFFIPTPGQFEQQYLAKSLEEKRIAPNCQQHEFSLIQLDRVKNYNGFDQDLSITNYTNLFDLFEREGELATNTKFTFNV